MTFESKIQVQQSIYSHQVSATCLRCSCNIYEWESRVYRTLTLESKIQVQCPFIVQQYSCNLHALGGLTFNGEILKVKNLMGAPSSRVILILMKFGVSISTWFQVVPFCSQISELFLFSLYDHSFRCPYFWSATSSFSV